MRQIDADALMEVLRGEEGAKALDHSPLRLIKIKKIVDETPTIPAIPVEWIQKQRDLYLSVIDDNNLFHAAILNDLIIDWRKEQKA